MAAEVLTLTSPSGVQRILGRRALILVPLLLVTFLVVWIGWLMLLAGVWSRPESLPNIDFLSFWAASSLTLEGNPANAYDIDTISRAQVPLPGEDAGFQHTWRNPPIFLFFILPLSLMPVAASLAVWMLAQAALLFSAILRICSDRIVLLGAIAFPATLWNFTIGQNGLLTAGLLAWGVLLLRDRPVIAGAVFGLIAYKPQFFPLVIVALVASKQHTAAVSALSTIAALSLASLAFFGLDAWEGFFRVAARSSESIYGASAPIEKMQSVSAMLLVGGLEPQIVKFIQGAVALSSAVFVFWLWRRNVALEYQGAGLALAVLVATPYSYHYDLPLLGLAVLWLGVRFQKEGWRVCDREVLTLAWAAPLLAVLSASLLGLTVGPIVLLLMLAVLARRLRNTSQTAVDAVAARAAVAV